MSDDVASCWVHRQKTVPLLFLHEHHKHPQAYGGEDDPTNLIWLCTECHDLLHRLATMNTSGRGGEVQDALSLYLPEYPAARERLSELIHNVLEAKAAFGSELATGEASDTPIDLTVTISRSIHAKLKALSQDWVHQSGRRSGLAAYAAAVLTAHALGDKSLPGTPDPPTSTNPPPRNPRRF
jgi:hypothetical protein